MAFGGGILRIIVDKPGGVGLDEVADASKVVSRLLDDHDIVPGRYTLEITSPGLERPLRSPEHYARAVGEVISVKLNPDVEGERRVQGVLLDSDDSGITVDAGDVPRRMEYANIAKAKTVFEWGSERNKRVTERSGR